MKRNRLTPSPGAERAQGDLFSLQAAAVEVPIPRVAEVMPAPVVIPAPAAATPQGNTLVEPKVFTVGELTRAIKGTLERGFSKVMVRGEVSGFRGANARGHLYFTLKDAEACLNAIVWASLAQRMKFKLKEGMSVVASGYLDVYAPQGKYNLVIDRLEPEGEGALALAFQQLKERLTEEGLMGERRKRPPRPLPFLPKRIGVVTSSTGAALQDFLRVLHGRHPGLSVLLCHARVQGDGADGEVVSAIQRLARTDVDVIVVTRGGGSLEDLWTFNEESVARAIHACPVPVVSAIGHEVDFTIADFVADHRAPTPSAAAEKLAPVLHEIQLGLSTARHRLFKAAKQSILVERHGLQQLRAGLPDPRHTLSQARLGLNEQADQISESTRLALKLRRDRLRNLSERLGRQHPQARLSQRRQRLNQLRQQLIAVTPQISEARERLSSLHGRLSGLVEKRLSGSRHRFVQLEAQLNAMSPLAVMTRGYSVAFRQSDKKLVRRAGDLKPGEAITLRLAAPGTTLPEECEEVDAAVTAVQSRTER